MTSLPLSSVNPSPFLRDFEADPHRLFPSMGVGGNKPPTDPVVVTGQQVGLLGGPLYTLLKIRSAVQEALRMSESMGVEVQAVFWLEDNDHDAVEASTVWLPEEDGSLQKHILSQGLDRASVADLTYTDDEAGAIAEWMRALPGRYADEVRQRLATVYGSGRSWADAFLDVLAPYLTAWNVRVIRASHVITSGEHAPLVRADLTSSALIDAIATTSAQLQARDLPLQATVPDSLFFLSVDGQRQRLQRTSEGFTTADGTLWTTEELLEILETDPGRFTPNVLGRPLLQDSVLSTVASVLGAAEIAYHAQLPGAYAAFELQQPTPLVRHHALVLDAKAERLLDKLSITAADLLKPWTDIEASAIADDVASVLDALESGTTVEQWLAPYHQAAQQVDATLIKSVLAAQASIENALGGVRGKLKGAIKRNQAERIDRLRAAWWMVYPNATLSERIIPLAVWEARLGMDALRIIVERVCERSRTELAITGVSDLATDQ